MTTTHTTAKKKTNYHFREAAMVVGLAMAVLVVLATVGLDPAQAAYPGANGKIAFASDRTIGTGVNNPTGDYEIFTMNPDGTGLKQLTNNTAPDYDPAFSTDGRWLVFSSYRDGNYEIYFTDSDGAGTQFRITNNTVADFNPTTLDGNKIAYESYRNGNTDIYVQDAVLGERNLTNNAAHEHNPVFSPDGTKIAFESDRDGNNEVYVMDSDGTDPKNLSNNPTYDGDPDWSPNGQRIAFASSRSGNYEIHVMNALDGSSQKRLTRKAASDFLPAWSPDGTKITFSSTRGGDHEIYTMKAKPEGEKNRPKNLTKNEVYDYQPDWQPLVN